MRCVCGPGHLESSKPYADTASKLLTFALHMLAASSKLKKERVCLPEVCGWSPASVAWKLL